ncbi:uncharacterized protein LOC135368295 [Ornithodoros turicata]|uniref:uncharacterized protein LOC135368295 n=1 Tax=Ornithodoros turicata TaxID=34597 RepID=UPI0031397D4D
MATSQSLIPRRSVDRSLRAFMEELVRSPSPDSACEQDVAWNITIGSRKYTKSSPLPVEEDKRKAASAILSTDDTQSESSDGSSNPPSALAAPSETTATRNYSTHLNHNQDSDGDSGIDSVERFSQRIGSTSSTDTDACHDFERKSTSDSVTFPAYTQRPAVEDSHSEQSMRHSCRKILAALYATQNSSDEKGSYRYRSLSMPNAVEHTLSAKRLSVPTATTGTLHIQNFLQCDQQPICLKDQNDLVCAAARKPQRQPNSPAPAPKLSVQPQTASPSAFNLESTCSAPRTPVSTWSNERHASGQDTLQNFPRSSAATENESKRVKSGTCPTSKEVDLRHNGTSRRSNLPLASPNKVSSQQNILIKDDTVYPPKGAHLSLPGNNLCRSTFKQDDVLRVYARPAAVVPEPRKLSSSEFAEKQCRTNVQTQIPTLASGSWSARQQMQRHCNNRVPRANPVQSQAAGQQSNLSKTPVATNPSSCAVKKQDEKHAVDGLLKATRCQDGNQTTASKKSTSMPALDQQRGAPTKGTDSVLHGGVEYAVVRRKQEQYLALSSIPRITSTPCILAHDKEPPLPPKNFMHKSNFSLYRGSQSSCSLSTAASAPSSPSGLFERVQGFGRSAKSALVKAFSTERIYRPQKTETAAARVHVNVDPQPANKNDTSLVKGLKNRISLRRKAKRRTHQEASIQINTNENGNDPAWAGGQPTHLTGQLLQLNLDGSQVVELRRPVGRSFGFFLARGRVHTHQGVFVSRMHDAQTQQVLQGLLDVGDEILEVNGTDVRDADIMQVNALMANQNTLLLTVLPYICRKDI